MIIMSHKLSDFQMDFTFQRSNYKCHTDWNEQ